MRIAARGNALRVARAVAFQYLVELAPVDGTEFVLLFGFIPAQQRVGHAKAQELRLRYGEIDELLPQLVVGKTLDFPALRVAGMGRIRIRGTKHHQRRPPPAIQRLLRHALLFCGALRQMQHQIVALALMETFFAAYAHHGARIRSV